VPATWDIVLGIWVEVIGSKKTRETVYASDGKAGSSSKMHTFKSQFEFESNYDIGVYLPQITASPPTLTNYATTHREPRAQATLPPTSTCCCCCGKRGLTVSSFTQSQSDIKKQFFLMEDGIFFFFVCLFVFVVVVVACLFAGGASPCCYPRVRPAPLLLLLSSSLFRSYCVFMTWYILPSQ
jgi:hypothetical protein